MTGNLDVTVAVNTDSGTINVTPLAKTARAHARVLAPAACRTGPPREMAA